MNAAYQPNSSINTWVTGTSANCPIEPPAVRMPSTIDRFSAGTNLRAWLMRILYNTVMSVYRHRQVAKEGPYPEGFDPEEGLPADLEVSDEVLEAVSNLPDDYRKVFLMAALEDSPYQEIAEKLGIPVGTVMSRLWRARQTLQRKLSPASAN